MELDDNVNMTIDAHSKLVAIAVVTNIVIAGMRIHTILRGKSGTFE